MNIHELDSYNLADAVRFHRRLNPKIWGRDEQLLPEVREKLLTIAEDFQEFLGVGNLDIQDITISGSNAAYSYTKNSDIDLHLVVEMPADPVYQELFNAKKYQYNDEHNIKIGGADVELYVQPADQAHHSQGIYSIKNSDWIQVPQRKRARVDDACVRDKTADLDARIHSAIKNGNLEAMTTLWDKIKTMRKSGLEQHGEFGCENISFKLLRNKGCIQSLKNAMMAVKDRELSLHEAPAKPFRYGFGSTPVSEASTPDGVSPSTRMFLSETDAESQVREFIDHVAGRLGIERMPEIVLHSDPEWSTQEHSFGRYEPELHQLHVSLHNRHIMDIMRTTAHELMHCRQHEIKPLPPHAGETGSPWEDQAHAAAGVIMRDWADAHPDLFDDEPVTESASGYIPTKKQANDPRYSMALTVDIHPGEVGRQANKMALKTNSQGKPQLLMKTVNLRESRDPYNDLNEPRGPETPPQMPAGTIKVDVSDMYDWYKLGQKISDLDSIKPDELGSGPPSTVFAFGSEDLENMYSHALTRLGLKTHDLDEPGEEDIDEGVKSALATAALAGTMALGAQGKAPEMVHQTVEPGDTVYSIARQNNVNPLEIYRLNKMDRNTKLEVGQRVIVPDYSKPVGKMPATVAPTIKQAPVAQTASPAPTLKDKISSIIPKFSSNDKEEEGVTLLSDNTDAEAALQTAAKSAGLTGVELAQFMAQTRHESWDFSKMKEVGNQKQFAKYDAPRKAKQLGNKVKGDGELFKGRGFIQLTGRDNYTRASKQIFGDDRLVKNPDLASRLDVGAQIALWFWKNQVRPNVSNFNNTKEVTNAINPGLSGLQDRHNKFKEYMAVL